MGFVTGLRTRRMLFASTLALACAVAVPLVAQKKQTPAARAPEKPRVVSREVPSLRAIEPARRTPGSLDQEEFNTRARASGQRLAADQAPRIPGEHRLRRAQSFDGDLRGLPQTRPPRFERPEREGPDPNPVVVDVDPLSPAGIARAAAAAAPASAVAALNAPAPPPTANFEGLDFNTWGNGHPPDTNGDVGPTYYIQSINTSLGIFDKVSGALVTAFSFNTFMSQGHFGNVCDTNNFGDPVVLYDTFEDRWVVTDFAFVLSGGNVIPPALQCFAVSKTGDPVGGGWNFYSVETPGGLGDYPKFGIWPDGVYMTVNMFGYAAGAPFQGVKVFALNKAQMYAGAPSVQVVSFDAPAGDFTILPANARLQTGTPSPGTPNYFLSSWLFTNALTVYKFHVDWNQPALSTFTGPDIPIAATSWPNQGVANAPSQGGNTLDVLQIRAMMQNQYSNIAGTESLWASHTVRRVLNGFAAPRWYQVNVTGGVVAPTIAQATTWDPDAANVMHRFMPSVAVNRQGDLALGYSTSSATTKPAIKYAGRLATDPIETFSQTEQTLIQGAGTQVGNCGGAACTRWGDYSTMTLDTDGCTFWYTNMYYAVDGLNHHTRIGSFSFPTCTPAANGSIQGTVRTSGGMALAGATVSLGTRTATTDANGFYLFSDLPSGSYPSIAASFGGYSTQTVAPIAVPAGATAVQDFALDAAPGAACFIDTTQSDFQLGAASNCDLVTSPGDVILTKPQLDQQQLTATNSGTGITTTQWLGQTFVPAISGPLTRIDMSLFCATCSGANPPIIVEIRTAAGGLPTSTVLATTSIPGFAGGGAATFSATFATPAMLTAGTQYAYTMRIATPRTGTYAAVFGTGPTNYPNGDRVLSLNSGGTWTVPTSTGIVRDLVFRTFMDSYPPSGTFVSSVKDANPAAGATPTWVSIGWTASVPAGTNVRFQAAASNSAFGPFNFVGPDGTAATFFANGDSLAQFNGMRYLKYRALLQTANPAVTPVLSDVTICFEDVRSATTLAVAPATGPYNGTATLTATLAVGGSGLGGKTVAFALNGTSVGSATTSALGEATLPNVSLAGITGGVYPGGVSASFAGDPGYLPSAGSNTLTVTRLAQTITFDPIPDAVATDPPITLSATGGDSGNPIVFSTSSTACSVSGNIVTLLAAGTCAINADQAGNDNYEPAPTVTRTFSIGFASQTLTFGALAPKTYGAPDFTVSATASSGLAVAFAAGGDCTVTGATVHITGAGSCTITATQPGDARYAAADPVAQSFSVARATLTVQADDKTKLFNTPNPPLTGTVTGVVNGDGITATYATAAVTGSPVGTYPIVPTIVDPAGRIANYDATVINGTLTIVFVSTGACLGAPGHQVLPPLAADGSSVFNTNRTVPVKFRVCDGAGMSIGTPGLVQSFRLIRIIEGTTSTDVSQAPISTNGDTEFRWDPTDRLWIFNLTMEPLAAGKRYVYRITLADGSTIEFSFTVR
jgi:MBG domain (YGX type)/Carboxypeptidase regulatory-like domain